MLNNPNRGNLEERTFYIAERDLRLKQNTEDWLAKTGNLVWDGARAEWQFFSDHKKKVLELGSGTGLVGIVAGASTILTDLPYMLPLIRSNIVKNDPDAPNGVEISRGDESSLSRLAMTNWDYILASEVVYDDTFFAPLIATLKALSTKQTKILLAYTHRHAKEAAFWMECKKIFSCEEVDFARHLPEEYQVANFSVISLSLK